MTLIARFGGSAPAVTSRRPMPMPTTPSPADLAAENARLKRALQRAQTERDILKRAASPLPLEHCMDGPLARALFGRLASGRSRPWIRRLTYGMSCRAP
ncbi:MAG: hypothetical protein AAF366_16155 [Pseudomonadota bacterium]